jgi:hypothetical protein
MANDEDDRVGYGRPPKARRFTPGQSGNPSGRPKKPPSTNEAFDRIARKKITTSDGRKVPMTDAIVLSQTKKALKGDNKAAQFVFNGIADCAARTVNTAPALSREEREIYERALRRLEKQMNYE